MRSATYHRGKDQPDHFIAPPGTKVGLLFPMAGKIKSEAGFDTFTVVGYFKSGMSEYDSTHVYVPLERLQRSAAAARRRTGDGRSTRSRSRSSRASTSTSWPRSFRSRSTSCSPMFFRVYTWEQKQGPLLGRRRHRAEHPQHPAVLHHRRGRLRHPGDLLDDRRREDARHRRHEGPGGLDRRHPGHLPRLRSLAGGRRQRRGDGRRAAVRPLHQRDREGPERGHCTARSSTTRSTTSTRSRRSSSRSPCAGS